MKMLVVLEVEVSKTLAETMQRAGFTLAPDGTNLQVKVANSPAVPRRKTKVTFVTNPRRSQDEVVTFSAAPTPDATPVTATDAPPVPESK